MLTVQRLKRKPKHFKSFTGLTAQEFDTLLQAVQPEYLEQQRTLRTTQIRQRKPGGGRHFKHNLAERLLMSLIYYRLHLTYIMLGYLFDLDDSRAGEEIRERMQPVLLEVLPIPMRDRLFDASQASPTQSMGTIINASKPPRIRTLEELLEKHPEIKDVLIDATEQDVPRPQDKGKRRTRYSGKKKTHTIKTQVLTTKKVILHLSESIDGSVSDMSLLRASGVMHKLKDGIKVQVDRGYEGLELAYPEQVIEKPVRGQRNHHVTLLGKLWNQMVSKERIVVEHMLCKLERFKILAGCYRARLEGYDDCFAVVAGLVNYKSMGKLTW
jgi:DDE superfamily endonuclease/Helix-turn-helix of DDE superfamily endonuclease